MKIRMIFATLFLTPIYSYKVLDLSMGTGGVNAKVKEQNYLVGAGTAKAETADSVYQRESLFFALRWLNYFSGESPGFYLGGEVSYLTTKPSTNGQWKFGQYNTDGNLTAETTQPFTTASAPGLGVFRGTFHLGFSIPVNAMVVPEFGVLVGAGFGRARYSYQSPVASSFNGGNSEGSSGFAVHAGLRAGVKIYPIEALALGIEYRYMAEAMGSIFSFAPGLQSDTASASVVGHFVLVSVGYRFGMEAAPQK